MKIFILFVFCVFMVFSKNSIAEEVPYFGLNEDVSAKICPVEDINKHEIIIQKTIDPLSELHIFVERVEKDENKVLFIIWPTNNPIKVICDSNYIKIITTPESNVIILSNIFY